MSAAKDELLRAVELAPADQWDAAHQRPGLDFQRQPEELSDGDSIAVQALTKILNAAEGQG